MTPPKVEAAPNPVSSVIINTIFGASSGGTMRAGHAGCDCAAFSLIDPAKGCGGGGRWRPSIVVVACGEPGADWVCAQRGPLIAQRESVIER